MKLDRMLGILNILLQNERVTAPYLAEKFEVTRRTIGRDIDALCCAGIPVVTHQGAGGGISVAEGFKLDKNVLTTDVLASFYKERLNPINKEINRAIAEKRLIEFKYFYEKGESHRRIEPYFVMFQWSSWYMFGFCLERMDWRMFKLMRMREVSVCSEKFSLREIPPEKRDFNSHFSDEIKLVALFDKSVKYQLVESADNFRETAEGLLLEFDFTNRGFLLSWLLSFGGKVKVLEPPDIVLEIQEAAKNILSRY